MTVAGMVKSSLVDYPGLVSCVLFVPGCNFDCFYCHNRSLLSGPQKVLEQQEVMCFLERRAGQLDAVVVSGGEPTLQPELSEFIASVRALGYKVKLDTNGSSPAVVEKLLRAGLCEYYAVDYKAPAARYAEIAGCGADADNVLTTIRMLAESGVAFEVRTTVVPQLGTDDLIMMAQELPRVPRLVLNPYRRPEVFRPADRERIDRTPYIGAEMKRLADAIRVYQPGVLYLD